MLKPLYDNNKVLKCRNSTKQTSECFAKNNQGQLKFFGTSTQCYKYIQNEVVLCTCCDKHSVKKQSKYF